MSIIFFKKTECLGFLAYLLFYCTLCMSTSFFIKKKTKCLEFLAYLLFYCTSDFYVFFFFHFLFVELMSDAVLTSELGMSTPTLTKVDG